MNRRLKSVVGIAAVAMAALVLTQLSLGGGRYLSGLIWPEPPIVTPGENNSAPSDAIVLFDGKNFDEWNGAEKFKIDEDGGFTVRGGLTTKKAFGDCQLHLEFASPNPPKGRDQGRGNNGIGLMGGRYEIQVLDSYDNKTYFEGQAASVYNQRPPMVNASRKPGEWQTYDIIFTAPRFNKDGSLKSKAYVTVLHNGVVVQNHTELQGDTPYNRPPAYTKHPERLPLTLMYHGDPVRFRNMWIRDLNELQPKRSVK